MNNNGNLLLEFCKQTGLRILNGRVGRDANIGKYTFFGYRSRGSSLVDYVLCSDSVFKYISSFEVGDPNILSDHCCIYFEFENFTESLCENIEAINAEDGKLM